MYPQIRLRYDGDHDGTRSRICIKRERFSFPHERLPTKIEEIDGELRERERESSYKTYATKVFAEMLTRERNEEELKMGGGSKSAEGKEHGRGKKNRKPVGKRNYRLMRRSFRHDGFERESAIGRCFFAEVIRVFVRSLSLFPSAVVLVRAPGRAPRASMIYHLSMSIGNHATSRSRWDKIMVDPNNVLMERGGSHSSSNSTEKLLYRSRFNYESLRALKRSQR